MSTLKVREFESSANVGTSLGATAAFSPTVKHEVRIEGAREAVTAVDLDGVADSDVLELELEDGVRI